MFAFFIALIVYLVSFGWLWIGPSQWGIGAALGTIATLVFCSWYIPRKQKAFTPFFLTSLLFFWGGMLSLFLFDWLLVPFFVGILALVLGWWWQKIYDYYHSRERFGLIAMQRLVSWFVPIGFFLVMSGAWGMQIFFGVSDRGVMVSALLAWVVLFGSLLWFFKVEVRSVWMQFVVLGLLFFEVVYVVNLLSFAFFVKGALSVVFFIVGLYVVKLKTNDAKSSQALFRAALIAALFLAGVLATARWR